MAESDHEHQIKLCQRFQGERDQAVEVARAISTRHEQYAEQQQRQQQEFRAQVDTRIKSLEAELAAAKISLQHMKAPKVLSDSPWILVLWAVSGCSC